MKNYAAKYPRVFAALTRFDQITAPFSKWLLLPMVVRETWEFLDHYPALTPVVAAFSAFAFVAYQLLFHLCVEEDFRAHAFSYLRQFRQR